MTAKIKENFVYYLVSLLPLILILVFFGNIVYYTTKFVERRTLELSLMRIEPYFLALNFILMFVFFILSFNDIKKMFKPIKKKTWIMLIAIFMLALVLRMFITPHTHRVFFDEDIYLDIGKEILTHWSASLCNYGNNQECYDPTFMKWPNGYPFLLIIPYSIFGVSRAVAFKFVALIGSLTVILSFFIAYLLSKKDEVGLYSALIFALIPVHIMWSGTTASEPSFVFFMSLTVFAFLLTRSKSWYVYFFAISSLSYAIQIRSEGMILLPIIGFLLLLFDETKERVNNRNFVIAWSLLFFLITPYLIHTIHAAKVDPWGSSEGKFGLKYMKRNIPENTIFWIKGYPTIEHPWLYTTFAFIGLIYLFMKQRKTCFFLLFWFFTFFMLYGIFYAGSVRYGADVRYSLTGYPSFVILAGFGLYFLHKMLKKTLRNDWIIFFLLIVFVLSIFYLNLSSIATPAHEIMEAKQARLYHDFVVEEVKKLPDNCYILSHTPSIFLIEGKPSLQTWNGQNEKVMKELFKKTDCVIFDDNYWCNIEPYKSSVCKHMFDAYNLTEIDHITVDTGQTYTLYRVENPFS